MADLERTIKILLSGQDLDLNKTLINASKDFDGFSRNIQSATEPLANFGLNVAKAEAALVALGVGGLVYAFGKAKEFESATIELDKVLSDAESGGLAGAKQAAIELSDAYGVSSTAVLGSIADFKQANFDLADSIMLAEDAMRLKIAGDLEAAESSEYLKRILSGFKAEAADATRVIDVMNAVSNQYNTDVRQLAIGMGDLSGVANTVGMSFEQTAGLLTPIIAVFGSGSEAANALKTGLIRLVDNTVPVVNALELIGVSQKDANGELKNAYDILGEVARAFETTDKSQQLFIAGEIFGKEQAAKMVQVISDWNQVLAVTDVALNSVGSAQAEVDKRLQSAQIAIDRAVVGWENLNIAVGDKFRTGATGAVNAFTDIENALRKSLGNETFDVIWDAINEFFANTQNLLKDIAKNLPEALEGVDFSGMVEAFKGLGSEVGDALDLLFGGELDLTTVEGLEDAIQRVINAITGMTNFTKGFIEGWEPILKVIGETVEKFGEMESEGQSLAGRISGWAGSINTLFEGLDTLKSVLFALAGISGLNTITTTIGLLASGSTIGGVGALTTSLEALSLSTAGLIGAFAGLVGAGAIGWKLGEWLGGLNDGMINDAAQGFWAWTDQILNWSGNADAVRESGKGFAADFQTGIQDGFKDPDIADEDFTWWHDIIDEYEKNNPVTVKVGVETDIPEGPVMYSWTDEEGNLHFSDRSGNAANEKKIKMDIAPKVDKPAAEEAKKDIQVLVEEIKSSAETVQTSIEWEAKVKIAQAEADVKAFEVTMASIDNTITQTTASITDLFGAFSQDLKLGDKYLLRDAIEQQLEIQKESFELQKKQIEAQTELINLRKEILENGEGLLTIKVDDSITPALKLVLMEILELVQVEMNEYANQYLLGVS